MRDVSPSVDGFEVTVDGVHRAAARADGAARELDVAVAAVRGLALAPDEVGPDGAVLAASVARFAGRCADRLAVAGAGLAADAVAVRAAAETYSGVDRWFAAELELLA